MTSWIAFRQTQPHDVTQQLQAMPNDCVLEPVDQVTSVRFIADDLRSGVARRPHEINEATKFDPRSPCHVGRYDVGRQIVKHVFRQPSGRQRATLVFCDLLNCAEGRVVL
jgi:hypothetical protein